MLTAATAAFGPGTGTTWTPSSAARRTRTEPGSLTAGVPASVTRASDSPLASLRTSGSTRAASSNAGKE